MRLRLDYYDQNEEFAVLLPRDGKIDRSVASADGNQWALFKLDSAVEYRGRSYGFFLLRSRWDEKQIGRHEPTSVFILLVDDPTKLVDGFALDRSQLVAWGMAHAL